MGQERSKIDAYPKERGNVREILIDRYRAGMERKGSGS